MDTMLKSWLFKDYSPNVQQFLDFFQEGIVIINKHGKIRYINKPYCTFLNVSKEKATGADIEKIIPTSELKKVMESGERQIGKYHVYGDNREVIGNRIPIYIDGRVEGMIGQVILKSRSELDQIISNYNIPRERVQSAERQIDQLTHTSVYCFDDIVAEDEVIRKVKEMARKAARSLPPLRDIPQSMILLCKRLLIKKAASIGCPAPRLSDEVEKIFQAYTWPGNARELRSYP